jgi:hypothetical protein
MAMPKLRAMRVSASFREGVFVRGNFFMGGRLF